LTTVAPQLLADAKSFPNSGIRPRIWLCVIVTVLGLAYLAWAGSGVDPRLAALWKYTRDGWLLPAPGLGHLWIASVLVISAVSVMVFRLKDGLVGGRQMLLARIAIIGIILFVALGVRLAVWRTWFPMPLDSDVIGARTFKAIAVGGRGWAIVADMLTLGILLLALGAQRRSLWLAALYAFHPVVIMQGAGNGSPIVYAMPVLVLLALGWRLQRWLRWFIVLGAAAACTWWLAHLALTQPPFDGWLAECLVTLGIDGRPLAVTLIAVEVVGQALVIVLAARRKWNLARTLGHILLAWAIVSPRVMPADVLPILVLLPLGWTRGGWVLGASILALYVSVPLNVGHGLLRVPSWVTFLVMVPVVVVAVEEWVTGVGDEERGG
jgi:hypothetical protein